MAKNICVVGAGRWGSNHIKTLHALGALGGVVEADESRISALKGTYPKARFFSNIEEALKAGFDGFTVATPAETHFEIAEVILSARKPVLVEKPLALNTEHATKLNALALKNKTTLMVGHVLLFHPAIRAIKELVQSGKIGKLEYIYSNRLNLGTVRTEENILWSFAPHDISIFQYLIGELPLDTISRGGAYLQTHIHDTTMTVLRYPNNIVGHIFVSWLHPFKEHRLVVIGSKGMLSFEDSAADQGLLFYEKGIDWVAGEPIKRDGPTEIIPYEKTQALTAELQYFIEHLENPAEIANGQNGIEVLQILEQATASLLSNTEKPESKVAAKKIEAKAEANFYVHPSSYVDDNVTIGEGTKVWHFSHIQPHAVIGKKCSIGQNVNIANNVKIGNFVKIQNNVAVYEGVELEDYVFCGPSMVFTNVFDPRSKYPQRGADFYLKTLVKEGASIGANATIVCGNTIGRHAFIGAGAVVTQNVPDYALMVGVPARRIGWMCECGEKLPTSGYSIKCPRCSLQYQIQEGKLAPIAAATETRAVGNL